jgi:cytochrome P450
MRAAHPIAYPALLASRAPVQRVPGLGVLVRDATLLRGVLMDPEHFTKTGPGSPSDLWTPVLGPSVLLNMEGADHAALRRRLAPLFSPGYVASLVAASLAGPMAALSLRLAEGEQVDMVVEAKRNASAMISQLVGLPAADIDDSLFDRVSSITRVVRLSRPRLSPRQAAHARAVLAELTAHARAAYRAGDEATVPGRMRSLDLSEDEAMGAVGAFVLTGTETLVSYVPRLVALLSDSGWMQRLAADRAPLEAAIAEGLRVTTPSPVMLRSAVGESSIGEVRVRDGDRVILATFAANGALGPFDPERNPAASLKQLWFGAGSHYCLGAPLAMAQVRATLGALLDAGGAQVVSRAPARGVLIPSYASLVVAA